MDDPKRSQTSACCASEDAIGPRAISTDAVTALANHRPAFLSFLVARVRNAALAEDLLQECYARAIDQVGALKNGDAAIAWFYQSLRNAVIDHARRTGTAARAMEAFGYETDDRIDPLEVAPPSPCRCVSRLARALKPEYRDALERVEVEGASVKEYAGEAGISASNAGVRTFRAREALRREVLSTCGACAEAGCIDCSCV